MLFDPSSPRPGLATPSTMATHAASSGRPTGIYLTMFLIAAAFVLVLLGMVAVGSARAKRRTH